MNINELNSQSCENTEPEFEEPESIDDEDFPGNGFIFPNKFDNSLPIDIDTLSLEYSAYLDKNLSYKDLGIYSQIQWLQLHPDELMNKKDVTFRDLLNLHKSGRDSIRNSLNKLIALHYIKRIQLYKDKTRKFDRIIYKTKQYY